MKISTKIVAAGCSIFAMLFGSGNLVLPLILAKDFPNGWFSAFCGFIVFAVIIPMLGLVASICVHGKVRDFFSPFNKYLATFMQFAIMSFVGPFGVIPICISVSSGAAKSIFNNINPDVFYILFSFAILFIIVKKGNIMNVIGKILTPIKITMLCSVVLIGMLCSDIPLSQATFSISSTEFFTGMKFGYLTMDLIGTILFAQIIVGYLDADKSEQVGNLVKNGIWASIIAGILLCAVYFGFFSTGFMYHDTIATIDDSTLLLPNIALKAMGKNFNLAVSITIIVTCFTTAVALMSVWANFASSISRKYKIQYITIVSISIFASLCVVSFLDFNQILQTLMPIIEIIYPILIMLSIFHIVRHFRKKQ